jgi:hypothetical protein
MAGPSVAVLAAVTVPAAVASVAVLAAVVMVNTRSLPRSRPLHRISTVR